MYDDDRDALAAEYVLGTLSADERDQAEALLAIDPGFAETVRVWERRLGELNVMVEAVEPPPDLWDKIKGELDTSAPHRAVAAQAVTPLFEPAPAGAEAASDIAAMAEPEPQFDLAPQPAADIAAPQQELAPPEPGSIANPPDLLGPDLESIGPAQEGEEASEVEVPVSSLLPPEPKAELPLPPQTAPRQAPPAEAGAEVIALRRGVSRWRGLTLAMSAIAAVLAVFVAVTQFAPGLIPRSRPSPPVVAAQPTPPAPAQRFVAVLQQEPTSPAFLLTVDPQSGTFTVRTVSATPEAGRSYELWLLSGQPAKPRSLGIVGASEFTTKAIPAGFDVDTMRGANYAISLEPAGGSPSGAPTGPILFTGKMVASLPGAPS